MVGGNAPGGPSASGQREADPRWFHKKHSLLNRRFPLQVKDVSLTAPWITARLGHWDVVRRIMELGKPVSPILQAPWCNSRIFRIDWLHAVDQGIAADWLGSLFNLALPRMPGRSKEAQCTALWEKVQAYYRRRDVQDRLQNLTPLMIKQEKKSPKLRSSAACCRALIGFGKELADELFMAGPSPVEEAVRVGMHHLYMCYQCLSNTVIFSQELLRDSSFRFAQQFCALDTMNRDLWRVKPKLHLFLELCIEQGRPTTCWTYRDEDWGGSVAKMSRRRGGLLSTAAYSSNLLDRFKMQQPMIRMRR